MVNMNKYHTPSVVFISNKKKRNNRNFDYNYNCNSQMYIHKFI